VEGGRGERKDGPGARGGVDKERVEETFDTAILSEFKTRARSSSCDVGVVVPINQPLHPLKNGNKKYHYP
jgi:hypothetical protein